LLAGLFALETHPIVGVLATLAAMALLLSAAAELSQAQRSYETNLQRKSK